MLKIGFPPFINFANSDCSVFLSLLFSGSAAYECCSRADKIMMDIGRNLLIILSENYCVRGESDISKSTPEILAFPARILIYWRTAICHDESVRYSAIT